MQYAKERDNGVSPVIGTILMVAITVILIAICAAVIMPMVGGTTGAATIGVQVVPDGSEAAITFTGGDYAKITKLVVTNGDEKSYTFAIASNTPVELGKVYTSSDFDGSGLEDVKVIATVNGNEQIIWQGKLNFPASTGSGNEEEEHEIHIIG